MPPKSTSRSRVTHDKALSPPKSSTGRQSQSPLGRNKRVTRSKSVENEGSDYGARLQRGSRRGARQGSAESADSNASVASSRGSRSRTATRAAVAKSRGLSTVTEGREMEEDNDRDISSGEEDQDHENEEHEGDEKVGAERSQSPGALSQMSGTTAISSFTAVTSHSTEQVSNVDPIIVDLLPGILDSSSNLIKLLAPMSIMEDLPAVESIVNEFKTLGSRRCKLLKIDETVFDVQWSNFHFEGAYIDLPLVLRALVGTSDTEEGDFRPDAVIHAANLAHLLRTFMVLQRGHRDSHTELDRLDLKFPRPFISGFENKARLGRSTMIDEFFDVGLEIRTQATIEKLSQFQHQQHDNTFTPEQILATTFYNPPDTSDPHISEFEDLVENGSPKTILHGEMVEGLGTRYPNKIKERVEKIRSTFRNNELAIRDGDRVDFEELNELYPWHQLQWRMARLARMRLKEIYQAVKHQGGVENIKMSLVEIIRSRDSQADVHYSPPSSITRSHVTEAERSPSPLSFYPDRDGKATIRSLQKIKQSISSSYPPQSAQPNIAQIVSTSSAKLNQSLPSQASDDNLFVPNDGDDDGYGEKAQHRDNSEYNKAWDDLRKDKNKENLPIQKLKKSLLDRQPDAQRVEWESQETGLVPSGRKRSREEEDEEESSESVDGDFQTDSRVPDPTRRAAASSTSRFAPAERPSPKRPRREDYEESSDFQDIETVYRNEEQRRRDQRERSAEEESDDEDGDIPGPTPSQVKVVAKNRAKLLQLKKTPQVPRKRIPWSDADEEYLIENIEILGCSWATLHQLRGWETERDQVALKDKARNIKVKYLKAGIDLPINFEDVALGRKEIEAVRKVVPDYEP